MAILKKTLFDEKLESYRVFLEDTETNSEYFKITELSDVLTGGKNSFLIQGSEQLDSDSIVKIQIRDSQGNTIYYEPGEGIPEYYEGTSKVVSVYIYPDTAFGPCTITILGELKEYNSNGLNVPIPDNWKGVYNVRWQKQINVNPFLQNTTKIRFYRRPKIDVQEVIFPVYSIDFNRKTISGSVIGTAINPNEGDDFRFFKGDTLYELNSTTSKFSSSMEGETITINGLTSAYATTIKEVVNSTKVLATIPYYETSSTDSNSYQNVLGFTSSPFTLSFDENSTLTNSFVSSSFAKITLTDLETFSGDVNRVKVYASRLADIGNYTLLEDIKLESNEILLSDSFSGSINVRTGLFNNQSLIDSYWIYREYGTATTYTKLIDNDLLIGSVKLLDLNTQNTSNTPQKLFYYSSSIDFTKNTEYQLNFNLLLSSSAYTPNKILIYGSGSSFVNTDDTLPLGKLIGEISTDTIFRKFDKQEFNFKPDADGTGTIVFAVNQGNWQVGNIGLRASQETNFSPNEVSLTVGMPTIVNDDTYDFKFEFYDINNNYVPVLVQKNYTFVGGTGDAVQRSISISSDINIFSFSGSGAPIGATSTTISVEKSNLSGSVTFYSAAFDINGNYLSPSLYAGGQYPGLLTNINESSTLTTAILTAAAFTGSLTSEKVTRVMYTASCDGLSDKLVIYRIEAGGAGTNGSNAIQYVIRPLNGTALKNNSGSLELQLSKIDGSSLIDLTSGNIKLVTGSANTAITAGGGITPGTNGIPYNAKFDSTKISGSLIVKAYNFDTSTVVDAITLVDVTDGIPAGVINSSNGLTFVRQTNNGFFFSPESSKVTASFFSVAGLEVSESIAITASYSAGSDFFKYDVLVDNPNVGLIVRAADGTTLTAGVAKATRTISTQFTYSSLRVSETFNIMADGASGSNGTNGAAAKTANLNSPFYVISYDKDGLNPTPTSLFPITASAINFTSPYFKFTGDVNTPEGTYTVGSSSTEDTASFTPPTNYFTTPKTFRVGVAEASAPTVELAYDTITIAAVKVGSTGDTGASTQMYFIRPLSGSQLRNSQGSLELQAVWLSGSTSYDLKSGSILLTTASVATAILRSGSGVTSGSNSLPFNAKFDYTAISGSRIVYLYDTGSNRLYDTITLLDTTDGVPGGSVIASSLFTRREPLAGGLYQYNTSTLPFTASFIGTSGMQYNTRITLFPSYSVGRNIDSMYYSLDASTASISFTADDGSGNLYTSGSPSNYKDTKDVTFKFTFTDPQTFDTSTTIETFYIISDGIDGDDAYTVVLTNDAHTAPTTNTGTVTYTNSGTNIIAYRGSTELNGIVSGTPIAGQFSASVVASNITAGTLTSAGNPIVVGDHSALTADLATVTYTINLEGTSSVTKVQSISKAKQGNDGQMNLAYVITPVSGTILKNKTGTLELRITKLSGSVLSEVTGGAVVLVTGSANTPISVGGGVTAGPNGILFNGIFDTTKISGSLVVKARDTGSGITYDTITLADITDGLTAGTINATNGLILTRNPNSNNAYTPTNTAFTGSFFDVRGNLYTSSLLVTANFSTVDQLKYTINQTNANMSLTVRDAAGNTMTNDTYANTTGINVRYVFTDPFSGDVVDCIETAKIASDGSNGVAFLVSNENTSLPAQSTGWVASGSFLSTSGSINVKVGTEDILFASPISNNRFSASISQSTNVGSTAVLTTNNYSIGVLTQDSGSLLLKIVYQDARGSQVSGSRIVTYSKSKAGVPNVLVAVSPSAQSINSNSRGSGSLSPTTLTVTALEGGTSRFTSIGTPTYTNGLAGSVSTNTIIFSSTASSMTSDTGTVTIPVNYTDSEGTTGTKNIVATVSRTRTAAPTVLAIFSKESQSITKTNTGTYGTPTTFTIAVNEGGSNYTYDAALSANNTYYVSSITGGSNSSGTITPTTPTTDAGTTVSITISYRNSEATTGTITKEHRVNVTINGDTGGTGADGRRTATGMVHYQIAASSAPSTPSATSYTFSTNAFTSLTANWGFGAPTYASGNSNKYWYSTYTAVETTAGGGTATPTFGSPVQAIGFSGLVTFTSANNITDGTNFSNIVPSGSITNHIGGANVTTIEGGKISTGVITSTGYTLPGGDTLATGTYTTAGTIFNLDNGSLRSKNFYIDSSGNAFFKGNIAAASITTGLGYTPPTPTQVTSSISAIKIGGRNLIFNSQPVVYNQIVGVVTNGATLTVDTTNLWKGQPTLRVSGDQGFRWLHNPIIEPYTEYIASMMVKADSTFVGSQTIPLHIQVPANDHTHEVLGDYDQTVTTDWKQIWLKFSSNQTTNTTFQVYLYNIGTTPFNVAWVKLEKGNKQTDWTPAPEDIASGSISNVDILGGSVLNYNPDFSISTVDGKPAGAIAAHGTSDNSVISFLDSNKNSLRLSDPSNTTIGFTMPAIRLNKDAQYNITFSIKSNSTTANGFYFRMQEIDVELPQGYTNIAATTGGPGTYTTSVRQVTTADGLTIVSGTSTESGPMTTSYVTYQITYRPTSTAKWVSPFFLKWDPQPASVELHVDRLTIQQDTSIKTQGSVGGWTIDSDSIFTGTKDTSGYSTTGITLYGVGSIHAPQFYIDTSGNAFFKGDITGASGTFSGTVTVGGTTLTTSNTLNTNITSGNVTGALGYTPPTTTDVNNAGKTAGSVGGWTINSSQIYSGTPGSDGAFNAGAGITLGGTGYISSKNFYIDSSGNAKFNGSITFGVGGSGINIAPVGMRYNPRSLGAISASNYDNVVPIGYSVENAIDYATDPFGNKSLVWQCYPDVGGGGDDADAPDGGWNSNNFRIDNTKTYKFVIYLKRYQSLGGGAGSSYWGTLANTVRNLSNSALNDNPYFMAGNTGLTLNKWYLIVGYVYGKDFQPTSDDRGGVYDCDTGQKVNTCTAFKWDSSAVSANTRAYLYYNTLGDTTVLYQEFFNPSVYEVDGTEPDLNRLLDKGKMVGNGSYSGGTFIDGKTVYAPNISGSTGDFTGKITATSGQIGGWIIDSDKLYSPPSGSNNVIKMKLEPNSINPQFTLSDVDGAPAVVIKTGQLLDVTAGAATATVTWNADKSGFTGGTTTDDLFETKYNTGESFSVSATGLYTGTITVSAANAFTPLASGYYRYELGAQIASDSGFSNILYQSSISLIDSFSEIGVQKVLPARTKTVEVNFISTGTYYIRSYWQRLETGDVPSATWNTISHDFPTFTLSKSTAYTELTDFGFQSIRSSTKFVKIQRVGSGDTMLNVGGDIEATGNITAYSSDMRLKTNINILQNPLEKLSKLNGFTYNWNDKANELVGYDTNESIVGMFAQDVQEVLPEAVRIAPFDNDGEGNSKSGENYLTVQYEKVVPLLVEAIKELKNEIEELKTQINKK